MADAVDSKSGRAQYTINMIAGRFRNNLGPFHPIDHNTTRHGSTLSGTAFGATAGQQDGQLVLRVTASLMVS